MNELSRLAPAQTYLILRGEHASQKDLLKFTFMDLLLKQVLIVTKRSYSPSKHDPVQKISYVNIGKNFAVYKPSPHENVFLQPFQKSKSISIMFRHMVQMGYSNSGSQHRYQGIIANTLELDGCVKQSFWQRMFGGCSLTEKGMALQTKLNEELAYFEEYLPTVITSDKRKALDVLKHIKGNIFLLKNIDFALLAEIDKELMEEMSPRGENMDSGCFGCISTWDTYGHDWHSFDSSCSSVDSGCGGSGCSGCSGCGGCGGGD